MVSNPCVGLGPRAVLDGERVPRRGEMFRHLPAHHAEPDKCQFCHGRRHKVRLRGALDGDRVLALRLWQGSREGAKQKERREEGGRR